MTTRSDIRVVALGPAYQTIFFRGGKVGWVWRIPTPDGRRWQWQDCAGVTTSTTYPDAEAATDALVAHVRAQQA